MVLTTSANVAPGSGQQGLDVSKGLLGLGLDALGHLTGCGVDAQLAGQEHHVASLDTGGIRADGCGCVIGRHDGLAHVFLLTSKRERERGVHTGRHSSV